MTAKSSRAASARQTTDFSLTPFNLLADLPRRQMALMAQSASALFRSSEQMRRIQQEAAQRATEHHEEAAARLRGECDLNDLFAVQADLLRYNMQEATQYWQQLATAALRLQADMVSSAGEAVLNGAAEPSLDTLQRAFEASLNGSASGAPAH